MCLTGIVCAVAVARAQDAASNRQSAPPAAAQHSDPSPAVSPTGSAVDRDTTDAAGESPIEPVPEEIGFFTDVMPILVIIGIIGVVIGGVALIRRSRRRKREKAAAPPVPSAPA